MNRFLSQMASLGTGDDAVPANQWQRRACSRIGLIGTASVFLIGVFRLLLPIQAADPVWGTFGLAGLLAGLTAATCLSTPLRRYSPLWIRGGLWSILLWAVCVAVMNQATGEYVLGLLVVFAGVVAGLGLSGPSATAAWCGAGGGLLLTGLGLVLGPSSQLHPLAVLASMAVTGAGVGGATQVHRSSQRHLREQRGQWRHLVENLQEAVLITVEGEVVYSNSRAAALFGASDTEAFKGTSVFDLIDPGAHTEMEDRLGQIQRGQSTTPYEHRATGLDGEERVVQSQSVPVQYNGGEAALTVVRDVTDWREAQETLTHRAKLQQLMVEISAGFIDMPIDRLDEVIEEALGTVGSFVDADRSYVFLFDGDPEEDRRETTGSNTHEWCAEGIPSQKADLQNIPCESIPWWMDQLSRREPLVIPSVDELPDAAAAEKEILEAQNIRSLVVLPMTRESRLIGFVGFDAVETQVEWNDETVTVLHVLEDAIASALHRKGMEEQLREREERLRAITENVSEGIYRSTPDEGLVYANSTFAELFGHEDAEAVLDIDPSTLYATPEAREQLREAAREQDSFEGVEAKFQRTDGSTFIGLVSGSIVRDEEGAVEYYDGAITDITERKSRERRLRVLSETVEKAQDGVLITEANVVGRIMYANAAFEQMTGYAEEELLGETPSILRGPDTDPEVIASLRSARAAGEPWTGETINYRKDGTPFIVQWTAVPVRNEEKEIEYWTAVQRDVTERRKMEDRLREREARIRGLANSIPGVAYQFSGRTDDTFETNFVSDHAESLLGISSDPDHFYDEFIEHVAPSHRDALPDSARAAVDREEQWRFEMPFDKPSGERIWLLGISTPTRQDDRLVYNGVLLDITERKEAERALRKERDRFETLFESLPTPVVRCTANDEGILIADVNEAFESVFGIDRKEAEYRDLGTLLMPNGEGGVGIDRQALTEGTVRTDVRCETTEGPRDFRIQVAGRKSDTGPPEGHAIYTDITARKRRERALEETNATLEAILENLPSGILAEDGTRSVLAANESLCSILGLSWEADELRGRDTRAVMERIAELFADSDRFLARTLDVLNRGEPVFDEEFRLENGGVVERDFVPYVLADDTAALWVYRDISERKQREQRLREAKDEAQEANRMKSVFLANMSHEIRTPLTSMIGFAEVIGDEMADEDEGPIPRFANLIEESGHRLLETLDSVLNLSKLEAGEMELSPEPVSVAEELGETAELFKPQAEEAGITLRVQTSDASLRGFVDPGGFRIVLRNLISNALKYTEDGHVWVRAGRRDGDVAVEVEDTGIGMNPDEASALFEAFRQESEGVAREYEGSGLGLAVTKRVVDQMDGRIDVETEKGVGTCFTVLLPTPTT